MHDYCSSLRGMTHGRAKFSMQFSEYANVPYEIQKKLADDYKLKAQDEE